MAGVQIIWSLTNGGSSLSEPVDHGNNNASNTLTPQTIYIRHTGVNPITNCSFYIRALSTTYGGDASALDDYNEIIAWGDASGASTFGGFEINMNATGGFPNGSWPTRTTKDADGKGHVFRTGTGDVLANSIPLIKQIYDNAGTDGNIPAGSAPNARFQARIEVPTSETTLGIRLFEQVLKFTFTS